MERLRVNAGPSIAVGTRATEEPSIRIEESIPGEMRARERLSIHTRLNTDNARSAHFDCFTREKRVRVETETTPIGTLHASSGAGGDYKNIPQEFFSGVPCRDYFLWGGQGNGVGSPFGDERVTDSKAQKLHM